MALMVGAMTIHSIQPGPQVMTQQPELFWGLIAQHVDRQPDAGGAQPAADRHLGEAAARCRTACSTRRSCCSAASACTVDQQQRRSTCCMTALFGFLGYIFIKLECEPAPLLLGFVLGPMMEENLRRALLLSRGDPTVFVTRPISRGDARHGGRCCCSSSSRRRCARSARRRSRKRRTARMRSIEPPRSRTPASTGRCPTRRGASRSSRATSSRRRSRSPRRRASRCSRAAATPSTRRSRPRSRSPWSSRAATASARDLFAILWDGRRARRPQRLGPRAGGVDARSASRAGGDARARLGHRHDSRRRVGLGRAVAALRRAALRRPVRARDPLRARRLRGVAGRRREMGAAPSPHMPRDLGWSEHFLPRGRAPTPGERFVERRAGAHARRRSPQPTARRSTAASSRSDGRARAAAHGGAHALDDFATHTRRLGRRRSRCDYRGVDGARDPAQRPGHRRADGARHPRELRPRGACRRTAPPRSTCRSRR